MTRSDVTYMPLAGWQDGLLRSELDGSHFDNHLQPGVLELVAESLPCPRIGEGFEVQRLGKKRISDFPPLELLQFPGCLWSILISILIFTIGVGTKKVFQLRLEIVDLDKTFLLLVGGQDLGVEFLPVPILESFTNHPALASAVYLFCGLVDASRIGVLLEQGYRQVEAFLTLARLVKRGVVSEDSLPGGNSCINELLDKTVNLRVFLRVQVVDVASEAHSPVVVKGQVGREPLVGLRPIGLIDSIAIVR